MNKCTTGHCSSRRGRPSRNLTASTYSSVKFGLAIRVGLLRINWSAAFKVNWDAREYNSLPFSRFWVIGVRCVITSVSNICWNTLRLRICQWNIGVRTVARKWVNISMLVFCRPWRLLSNLLALCRLAVTKSQPSTTRHGLVYMSMWWTIGREYPTYCTCRRFPMAMLTIWRVQSCTHC